MLVIKVNIIVLVYFTAIHNVIAIDILLTLESKVVNISLNLFHKGIVELEY